ncbi:hypothetical protein BDW22DRAFT_1349892 [Trametopsis cervina]|nr:hypothetical protein BDW22DRAFT_1349892 [Trametopsis cervina]
MPVNHLNLTSGRPDNADFNIVPRTPHSRSGRAEEGFTEDDLHDDEAANFATYRQQQTEPLLASSASTSFPTSGYRSRGDDVDARRSSRTSPWGKHLTGKTILSNIPLLAGAIAGGILFSLIIVSFRRPDVLDEAIGYTTHTDAVQDLTSSQTSKPSHATIIDTVPPPELRISYENYTKFPLTGKQYRNQCTTMMGGKMKPGDYWDLPPHGVMDVAHHDEVPDYYIPEGIPAKVCSKTLTYQLDGHVGLVADLALMAQAAALARERNRTFFVDDTYWNRGKWTDHFQDVTARQPGPEPGCKAPPPEELVACPRFARYVVVNSRTSKFHFGHHFANHYENAYKHAINRQKPMFEHALESFSKTIRPSAHNAQLIRAARTELAAILSLPTHASTAHHVDPNTGAHETAEEKLHVDNLDPYIAVHIRRGDRKAASWSYHGGHVGLDEFVQATKDTWARLYPDQHGAEKKEAFPIPPVAYIASDSHSGAHEFISAFPPSTAIFSLDSSTNADLRALAPQREYVQAEFNELDESERIRLTRGMIVDLAMLSGLWSWPGEVVPGATICTLTSNVCKISAIGLGWNRAWGYEDGQEDERGVPNPDKKRWVEIDNKGAIAPEWTAFEVFS